MKIQFTEVTANGVNLNKTFYLDADNKIVKNANAHMSKGDFRVLEINDLSSLDNYFNTLASNQAIIAGIPRNNLLQGSIVPSGKEAIEYSVISRTNHCFKETPESVLAFDLDNDESMPEHMKQIINPQDFLSAMIKIIPELKECELFIRPSSSSNVFNSQTNSYIYNTGSHMYISVNNCTKENLNNFIEYIKRKSLEVGLCYGKIYKNGSVAFRTLIDLSPLTSLCSRLIFEARPSVIHPLEIRQKPTIFHNQGSKEALDLSKFDPSKLPDYRSAFEDYKKTIASQIQEKKNLFIEEKEKDLILNGIDGIEAKKIVKKFIEFNEISCQDFLIKQDGNKVKILDTLLSNNKEYYNDFLEVEKKGKAYISKKGIFDSKLVSFSRGGCEYKINFDFNSIKYILENLNADDKYKIKCLIALEYLLFDEILVPNEIIEIEKILKEKGFLGDNNNSFCEKIFNGIKEKKALEAMKDYAVLLTNGNFSIIDMTQKKLTIYRLGDIKNFFKNKKIRVFDYSSGKYQKLNPVDIWMESSERKEFTDITFDPSNKCAKNIYNLFRGFKYEPKNLIDISLYHDLLKNVICSGDEIMHGIVWTFFAQIIQEPIEKVGVCLILLSGQGAGKGTAIDPIVELLDGYSFVSSDSDTIFSRFNHHLSDKLFIYYNEAAELNYNKSLNSKFKHLVTESHTSYEIKNGPTYMAPNLCRVLLDSNEDSIIQETGTSRRTKYPIVSNHRAGDNEYFSKLRELYATPGFYETLMYQLSTFDIQDWKPLLRKPLKNKILLEQQLQSLNSIQSWWLSNIEENRIFEANYELTSDGGFKISNEELYNSFVNFTRKSGNKVYDQKTAFGKLLKKHCINDELITIPNAKDSKGNNAKVYANLLKCWQYFKIKHKLELHEVSINQWLPPKFL